MKNWITYFLLVFVSFNLHAQLELWPTRDMVWNYSYGDGWMSFGYRTYTIESDTIINGKVAQKYSILFTGVQFDYDHTAHPTQWVAPDRFLFLEDSVLYVYASDFVTYDTVIDFAAKVGDSWMSKDQYNVENKTRVVDRSFVPMFGNQLVLTLQLEKELDGIVVDTVTFHQLFGPQDQSFLFNAMYYQITDMPSDYLLRCFSYHEFEHDQINYIASSDVACDYIPYLSVDEANSMNSIQVTNPSLDGRISFHQVDVTQFEEVIFTDLSGKQIDVSYDINQGEKQYVSTQPVAKGMLVYRLRYTNGAEKYGRVIVE